MDYVTRAVMGQQLDTYNDNVIEIIEELIEQEQKALAGHRKHVSLAADPRLKSLIMRLA